MLARKKNTLRHLAIVLDGNRRYAKRHAIQAMRGHELGYSKVKEVTQWCIDASISFLTLYAFSTENWLRKPSEVRYLLDLFRKSLKDNHDDFNRQGVRVRIIGRNEDFPEDIQVLMAKIEEDTKNNSRLLLQIALSYGGRQEIVSSVKEIVSLIERGEIVSSDVNEELISSHLWTRDIPDPDLIIRTGGEKRLSNFLPWQGIYTELYFSDILWPDFSNKDFLEAVDDFHRRKINKGR